MPLNPPEKQTKETPRVYDYLPYSFLSKLQRLLIVVFECHMHSTATITCSKSNTGLRVCKAS